MKLKLVTDNPQTNIETLHNFCRSVDGRVKFIETTAGKNTDSYDFCRHECKRRCNVDFPEQDDGTMLDMMTLDCMYEQDCTNALLYISAIQAAELREQLKLYEETGVSVKKVERLKEKVSDLEDRHWNECQQISKYSDEAESGVWADG